jgi:hypothetical protein
VRQVFTNTLLTCPANILLVLGLLPSLTHHRHHPLDAHYLIASDSWIAVQYANPLILIAFPDEHQPHLSCSRNPPLQKQFC